MKIHVRCCYSLLVCALLITGCGNEPQKKPSAYVEAPEAIASRKAEHERQQAEFAAIKYPDCSQVWSGEKLAPCGIKRLETSLMACGEKEGTGTKLDALSAGDSWIFRAGAKSVQTTKQRAQRITKSDLTVEPVAYLMGDNTDGIKVVDCYMDKDMKLISTGFSLR